MASLICAGRTIAICEWKGIVQGLNPGGRMTKRRRKKTTVRVTKTQRIYRVVKVTRKVLQCERPYVLFGEAVRVARRNLGITQKELSDKMGISRGSIANIEVGRQRIFLGDIFNFAKALHVTPSYFFKATIP